MDPLSKPRTHLGGLGLEVTESLLKSAQSPQETKTQEQAKKLQSDAPENTASESIFKRHLNRIKEVRKLASEVFVVAIVAVKTLFQKAFGYFFFPAEKYCKEQKSKFEIVVKKESRWNGAITNLAEKITQKLEKTIKGTTTEGALHDLTQAATSDIKDIVPAINGFILDLVTHVAKSNDHAESLNKLTDNQLACGILLQVGQFVMEKMKDIGSLETIEDPKEKETQLLKFYTSLSNELSEKLFKPNENDPIAIRTLKLTLDMLITTPQDEKTPLLPSILYTIHTFYQTEQKFDVSFVPKFQEIETLLKGGLEFIEKDLIKGCKKNRLVTLDNMPEVQMLLNNNIQSFLSDDLPKDFRETSQNLRGFMEVFILQIARMMIANILRPTAQFPTPEKKIEHLVSLLTTSTEHALEAVENLPKDGIELEKSLRIKIMKEGKNHPMGPSLLTEWEAIKKIEIPAEKQKRMEELQESMIGFEWAQQNLPLIMRESGIMALIPTQLADSPDFWQKFEKLLIPALTKAFETIIKVRKEARTAEESWKGEEKVQKFATHLKYTITNRLEKALTDPKKPLIGDYPFVSSIISWIYGVHAEEGTKIAEHTEHAALVKSGIGMGITFITNRILKTFEGIKNDPNWMMKTFTRLLTTLSSYWNNAKNVFQIKHSEVSKLSTPDFCKKATERLLKTFLPEGEKDLPLAESLQSFAWNRLNRVVSEKTEDLFANIEDPTKREKFILDKVYAYKDNLLKKCKKQGIEPPTYKPLKKIESTQQLLVHEITYAVKTQARLSLQEKAAESVEKKSKTFQKPFKTLLKPFVALGEKAIAEAAEYFSKRLVKKILDPEFPDFLKGMIWESADLLKSTAVNTETKKNVADNFQTQLKNVLTELDLIPKTFANTVSEMVTKKVNDQIGATTVIEFLTDKVLDKPEAAEVVRLVQTEENPHIEKAA